MPAASLFRSYPMVISTNDSIFGLTFGINSYVVGMCIYPAFTLEMLGWRSHRQVWMASVLFFVANLNLMVAIVDGYRVKKLLRRSSEAGRGLTRKAKAKQL